MSYPMKTARASEPVGVPTTQQLLAVYLLSKMVELFAFWRGAAVHQKVLQYPVKSDSEGRVNTQWKMKTFPSKSNSFFGISGI